MHITDEGDGSYTLSYRVPISGKYALAMLIGGDRAHIAGSPFTVHVEQLPPRGMYPPPRSPPPAAAVATPLAPQPSDEAADTLLAMIERDREWNDGAARTKLLQIFEAVGLEDPWVVATRRRLSKILFG